MKPGWISEAKAIFLTLNSCNTRVIRADCNVDLFWKMVERNKVNVLIIKSIDVFETLKSKSIQEVDLKYVRMIAVTGQHLSPKLASDLQKLIPNGIVQSNYGMSEIACGVTDGNLRKPSSVGRLIKNIEARVVDENGKKLDPNETGEIQVRPIAPFFGYYNNEKLTQESVTDDGFYKTGDIGYIDDECYVFLVDRKKSLISYRGEWINQKDIENIVMENVKEIQGVCVVDVESDEHGVIPVIAIVRSKGVDLSENDILDVIQQHHPIKFETKVFFFDSLPITISGKYRKHIVREQILRAMH